MVTLNDGPFDDEEDTLPPLPYDDEPGDVGPGKPSAIGDFRTHKTTLAARRGGVFEVRLVSEQGDVAHFAVDAALATRVADAIAGALAEPYFAVHSSPPVLPAMTLLSDAGTDVFFEADDLRHFSLTKEHDGDRLRLLMLSGEASVSITMQAGVATALRQFYSGSHPEGDR